MINFQPVENYDLSVGSSGTQSGRIIIFRSQSNGDDFVDRVDGANIIIIGQKAKQELYRLVSEHGRPTANELIPGGISGRAYPALRAYFGLS